MITTILIVLVAVVVLIVIIAVLALHFLRADDSDSFDEIAAEPRRARRSSADSPRELVPAAAAPAGRRPRRADSDRDQWAAAERPARSADERAIRAVDDRPGRALDERPASYRDRDTGPRPAVADRRTGQTGGQRPVAASARAKPSQPKAVSPDAATAAWDSLSDVDYWAELAADKPQVTAPPAASSGRPNSTARRGHDASPAARPAARRARRAARRIRSAARQPAVGRTAARSIAVAVRTHGTPRGRRIGCVRRATFRRWPDGAAGCARSARLRQRAGHPEPGRAGPAVGPAARRPAAGERPALSRQSAACAGAASGRRPPAVLGSGQHSRRYTALPPRRSRSRTAIPGRPCRWTTIR